MHWAQTFRATNIRQLIFSICLIICMYIMLKFEICFIGYIYRYIGFIYIYKLNNSQSKYWVLPYTALLFLTSIFNSIIWKIERYVSYNIKSSLFTFPFLYYYYHPLFLQNILASWKINYLDTPNNVSGSKRESSLIYT